MGDPWWAIRSPGRLEEVSRDKPAVSVPPSASCGYLRASCCGCIFFDWPFRCILLNVCLVHLQWDPVRFILQNGCPSNLFEAMS